MSEWRRFEEMVANIERALAPYGAVITSPDHLPDLVSGQLREVDASIRFQIGSTPILITVECRRRGAIQDLTWIEQLASKKENIGASATLAVSSSGFSAGALEMAKRRGIETRTLTDVTGQEAADWVKGITVVIEFQQWTFAKISVETANDSDAALAVQYLNKQIEDQNYEAILAYRRSDRDPLILGEIGSRFMEEGTFPKIPGIIGIGKVIFDDQEFFIPTTEGTVAVKSFEIQVKIVSTQRPTPLVQAFEYSSAKGAPHQWAELIFKGPGQTEVSLLVSPKSPYTN